MPIRIAVSDNLSGASKGESATVIIRGPALPKSGLWRIVLKMTPTAAELSVPSSSIPTSFPKAYSSAVGGE